MDSGFQVLDSSFLDWWNMGSEFQSLVWFRIPLVVFSIPKVRISDSTSKTFPGRFAYIYHTSTRKLLEKGEGQTIDPLSSCLNACKCPIELSRITAVILGFSGVKGTNSQILPPNVYDEQPRLLAFGKRKWGKRVNPCAHDNYLRSIISSTQVLRRPMFLVILLTVWSTPPDSSHNRFLHLLTPARTIFPSAGTLANFSM